MSGDLHVHIGDSLDRMGQRFVDAWHRLERGEGATDLVERHAWFATFQQLRGS